MKKLLLLIGLSLCSAFVNAEIKPYIEGSVGYFKMNTTNEGNFKERLE